MLLLKGSSSSVTNICPKIECLTDRYKNELRKDDKDNLRNLLEKQRHKLLKSQLELSEKYVPMSYNDYLEKMSKEGEWGDHVALQAAADRANLNAAQLKKKTNKPKRPSIQSLFVILSNYYDLPFNDILDWHKFAVILKEHDVYQLKQILKDMPDAKFVALHKNLVKVQRHFQWNSPPIRYDAFQMVMYELWLRRNVIKY